MFSPYQVVGEPATGDMTNPSHKFQVSSDNAQAYPVVKQTITVVLDAPEIEESLKQFIRPTVYKPAVRELQSPKWRLRQQRPRDGLHS